MKTAYVTGSTGFLGLNIIELLLEDGWRVLALRRSTSRTSDLDRLDVTQLEGDVTDAESLLKTLPEGVDAVFHVAADTSTWSANNARQMRINVDGTRNMVAAAIRKKARRFIHTSSIGAYGKLDGVTLTEDTPSNAMTSGINYYRSKFLAESAVREGITRGLDAVILNPAQVVGPYDYNYNPLIFNSMLTGQMKGVPRGNTVCGHVRDYARAHLQAYYRGRCGENYLLGGQKPSFRDMFATIGEILEVRTPKATLPAPLLTLLGFIMERISRLTGKEPLLTPEKVLLLNHRIDIDSSKAERELGFSTCSLEEMFRDAYEWSLANGLIVKHKCARAAERLS
ncbi:MAG: SDR family oxidoreductase [Ketobacteraceae bacterium]|nr:SDR family oxidoreductase [Ketobacteraceae bacterium]